ncbi:MAG: hypothetical protein AB7P02_15795 [Alphaproteobacteria bacterium]
MALMFPDPEPAEVKMGIRWRARDAHGKSILCFVHGRTLAQMTFGSANIDFAPGEMLCLFQQHQDELRQAASARHQSVGNPPAGTFLVISPVDLGDRIVQRRPRDG